MLSFETDWLDVGHLKSSAARRFAEFCLNNWQSWRDNEADFDEALYQEAIQLVLDRLEHQLERGQQEL